MRTTVEVAMSIADSQKDGLGAISQQRQVHGRQICCWRERSLDSSLERAGVRIWKDK